MLVLSGLFAVISISFAQPSGLRQARPVHPDGMRPIRVPGMPVRTVDEAVKNPEAVVRLDLSGQTGFTDLSFLGQTGKSAASAFSGVWAYRNTRIT